MRGFDAITGEAVEVRFDRAITGVDSYLSPLDDDTYVSAGFIDLQINGFAGVDYNNPETSVKDIERSLEAQFATGVTRLLPTVITGSQERMESCLRRLAEARETARFGSAIEGFHVEGPHISPEEGPRGAHPVAHVRPPSLAEFDRLQAAAGDLIRLVTISPEWPEAPAFIEAVTRRGVVVSIGHTRATPDQIAAAVSAGATMSTHLGNGAHATLPKFPNYIWTQMAEDRLTSSFIADGIHLNDDFLKVALRAKGIALSVLVTDAVAPAGCPAGHYRLGEQDVELNEAGRVVLRGTSRLAGSSLRMDRGISYLMQRAGLSLRDAITMASRNPARVGRINARLKGLVPGERADLVRFRYDRKAQTITVLQTWIGGELAYAQ